MEFEENDIVNSYLSAIEMIENVESLFSGTQQRHYLTIHQHLMNCCHQIDAIITLETNNSNFLMPLFQQKQQLTALITTTEKLIQEEMLPENINNWDNRNLFNSHRSSNAPVPQIHESEIKRNEKNDKLMSIVRNSIEIPKVTGLNQIIGLHEIKKTMKSLVILPKIQPQLFQDRRICNSILLYGPPGTGKTRLAHALAAEANAIFHSITAGDVLSHFVGQTEKTIKTLFQYLKKTGEFAVLFIDEIDAFCRKRASNEQEHSRRIKTEFMCQMSNIEDCRNIFVICATNCPWDLDSAILRRLQKRIYVPLPTQFERLELFQFFTQNSHFDINLDDWTPLLHKTDGYSGSDLFDVVQSALNIPLNELEDTKIWKCSDDGFYEPVLGEQDFSNVVCSELRDLPSNTVKARKVQMNDLLTAVDSVTRTVPSTDVKKYERFNGI